MKQKQRNIRTHLLIKLNEEALEIGQAVDKALTFGLNDTYKGTTPLQDIAYEFNDLIGVINLLKKYGFEIPGLYDEQQIKNKEKKVTKYMIQYGVIDKEDVIE